MQRLAVKPMDLHTAHQPSQVWKPMNLHCNLALD